MGDPPRHLAPRLHPLNLLNLGDVLYENHDPQDFSLVVPQGSRGHHHRQNSIRNRDLDFTLDAHTTLNMIDDLPNDLEVVRPKNLGVTLSQDLCGIETQHLFSRLVHCGDSSPGIHRDHSRRDVCHQCLRVLSSLFELQIDLF